MDNLTNGAATIVDASQLVRDIITEQGNTHVAVQALIERSNDDHAVIKTLAKTALKHNKSIMFAGLALMCTTCWMMAMQKKTMELEQQVKVLNEELEIGR